MQTIYLLLVLAFGCLILVCDSTLSSISFYGGTNRDPFDASYGNSYDQECNNISQTRLLSQFPTKSVITETCLIVYENFDCNHESGWSMKVLPPGVNFDKEPKSYQRCERPQDDSQLDVYILRYDEEKIKNEPVLGTYRHVCSCQNVPENVQRMEEWSISNFGDELLVYFESNCLKQQWKPNLLEEGSHLVGREIVSSELDYGNSMHNRMPIKSFGPNPNSTYFKTRCLSTEQILDKLDKNEKLRKGFEMLENKLQVFNVSEGAQKEEYIKVLQIVNMLKEMVVPTSEVNDVQISTTSANENDNSNIRIVKL